MSTLLFQLLLFVDVVDVDVAVANVCYAYCNNSINYVRLHNFMARNLYHLKKIRIHFFSKLIFISTVHVVMNKKLLILANGFYST